MTVGRQLAALLLALFGVEVEAFFAVDLAGGIGHRDLDGDLAGLLEDEGQRDDLGDRELLGQVGQLDRGELRGAELQDPLSGYFSIDPGWCVACLLYTSDAADE